MSGRERGLRAFFRALMVILLAVLFGPWILMLVAAWVFEPRPGSWGAWPHIVGLTWTMSLLLVLAYGWFRR